jgi:predicted phage tail protein
MERKVIALGCTSRSQAHRLGKWFLFTNQTETDMVQFSAGVEATYLRPGDVVKLQDKLKTSKRYGGRLTAVDHASFTVTLDQGIKEDIVGQKITFIVPRPTKSVKDLNATAIQQVKDGDFSGVSADSINQRRDSQIKQYTIASVSTNSSGKEGGHSNVITVSETTDEEFDRVQMGTIWSVQNTDSDFNIKEVEYRVTSVSEQSQGEYQVTGLLYNRSKFNAIDFAKDLTPSQQSEPQVTILVDNDRPEPLDPDTSATSATFLYNNLQSLYFDYEFTSTRTQRDVALRVDFSNAAESSGVNTVNTGGYIIDISMDGDNRKINLYGAGNTDFQVFLGARDSYESISYSIYRFDTSFVLQETGNPDE